MKLYLSGPMTGYPDYNAPAFKRAAAELRGNGYEVVVPHELDMDDRASKTWADFIARDIKLIADGGFDGIVLLPGWEQSKGAKLEIALALILGMRICELDPERGLLTLSRSDAKYDLKEAL